MNSYAELEAQSNPFREVIMQLNALIPVVCVLGLFAGGALLMCKNTWGYYIIGISLIGLVAKMFIAS